MLTMDGRHAMQTELHGDDRVVWVTRRPVADYRRNIMPPPMSRARKALPQNDVIRDFGRRHRAVKRTLVVALVAWGGEPIGRDRLGAPFPIPRIRHGRIHAGLGRLTGFGGRGRGSIVCRLAMVPTMRHRGRPSLHEGLVEETRLH